MFTNMEQHYQHQNDEGLPVMPCAPVVLHPCADNLQYQIVLWSSIWKENGFLSMLHERSFDNPLVQASWTVSLGFNPVVILMCLVIDPLTWAPTCPTKLCWYCICRYHNGNYSIDFQVYRKDLSFFAREVLVSGIYGDVGGEFADGVMGRTIHAVCDRQ